MKNKQPNFVSLDSDINSLTSLIFLAKGLNGTLPTKEELISGAEILEIELTPEIKEELKKTFPELDI